MLARYGCRHPDDDGGGEQDAADKRSDRQQPGRGDADLRRHLDRAGAQIKLGVLVAHQRFSCSAARSSLSRSLPCLAIGTDNLTRLARKAATPASRSRCGGRSRPRPVRLGPELAKGRAADQMGLEVEYVVDGGVGGEKPLS